MTVDIQYMYADIYSTVSFFISKEIMDQRIEKVSPAFSSLYILMTPSLSPPLINLIILIESGFSVVSFAQSVSRHHSLGSRAALRTLEF